MCLQILSDKIIYTGTSCSGESYVVGSEPFILPTMQFVVKRYPRIRNLYYKWDKCHGTEHPQFKVIDSFSVFNDVWSQINSIQAGEFIIIAKTHRDMHIYKQKLLRSVTPWKFLEDGLIYGVKPYIVISK